MAGKRGNRDENGRKVEWRPPGSTVPPKPIHNPNWRPRVDYFATGVEASRVRGLARTAGLEETVSTDPRKINPHMLTDAQLLELVQKLEKADRYDWAANAR